MKLSRFSSIDIPMLIAIGVVIAFSLITLFTIDLSIFKREVIFLVLGIIAMLFFTQINPSVLRYYSLPIYVISLFLLIAVLFLGHEARGSSRWFTLFGVSIQFSEILKPFLAFSLASFLTGIKDYSFKSFLTINLLLLPVALLIFLQPDLGSALIYVFVTIGAIFIYGFPIKWFVAGILSFLSSTPFLWLLLHDYQRNRVLTFLDPSRDPLGTSYNAIQAVIAIGSGMIMGKGLGQGTQAGLRFLPERHTDFIFATISEELGFIGSLIIVLCFAFIFYRLFLIIRKNEEKFSRIFSILVFMVFFVSFFINVGMNIGIVPIVGVTLPFVSYGGSSLLSNFILLGLLFAVNRKTRDTVLEIR